MFRERTRARKDCEIPSDMVPRCPVCGGNMAMHLRCDQYFVEDEHWNEAAGRYAAFLKEHQKDKVVLLELGVGFNTPTIIRFPFEKMDTCPAESQGSSSAGELSQKSGWDQ